jgi:hypothetical protein
MVTLVEAALGVKVGWGHRPRDSDVSVRSSLVKDNREAQDAALVFDAEIARDKCFRLLKFGTDPISGPKVRYTSSSLSESTSQLSGVS